MTAHRYLLVHIVEEADQPASAAFWGHQIERAIGGRYVSVLTTDVESEVEMVERYLIVAPDGMQPASAQDVVMAAVAAVGRVRT